MTTELVLILIATLFFIGYVFTVSENRNKNAQKPEPKQEPPKQQRTGNVKSDTIIDTLDWMLRHSIITPEEYTKLMGKCLPFL